MTAGMSMSMDSELLRCLDIYRNRSRFLDLQNIGPSIISVSHL